MHQVRFFQRDMLTMTLLIGLSFLLRVACIGWNDLLVEEAYYWNYAQHLDFGYLDHPPLVAVLIRASTALLGTHEFGVRVMSIVCWVLASFFSFKLTNLIARGCGWYAVFLMAILPFFFLQSLIMTPDQPLLVCWSAGLYCFYRALILDEAKYWLVAGGWLGLGMLSKYTMVLLGLAAFCYVCIDPASRRWFRRWEPYAAVGITVLLFTPVIYWNITHAWVSFVFQSSRRMSETFSFSLHQLFSLLVFFLTPLGLIGLWKLVTAEARDAALIPPQTKRFLHVFTSVPLVFFGIFSVTHALKFNWIGTGLLAIIPWLALEMNASRLATKPNLYKGWLLTAVLLLLGYSGLMVGVISGRPAALNQQLLSKYIGWNDLTEQVYAIARGVELKTGVTPVIVPLERYNLSSELTFYQAQALSQHRILKTYAVQGSHVFGGESLMYRYWSMNTELLNHVLILVSDNPKHFDNPTIKQRAIEQSSVQSIWSSSQGEKDPIRPYYYQVVKMKSLFSPTK
jgi:hypothetical protein